VAVTPDAFEARLTAALREAPSSGGAAEALDSEAFVQAVLRRIDAEAQPAPPAAAATLARLAAERDAARRQVVASAAGAVAGAGLALAITRGLGGERWLEAAAGLPPMHGVSLLWWGTAAVLATLAVLAHELLREDRRR
jgi:hypothetical protein